ncbi:hypothetical protein DFJ74DRAFT_247424 [Hyaloraphidium curvatum]|nr:hypothetical protein DFJ74DRAFT_247424 [Hyaloraphidium curvatum]
MADGMEKSGDANLIADGGSVKISKGARRCRLLLIAGAVALLLATLSAITVALLLKSRSTGISSPEWDALRLVPEGAGAAAAAGAKPELPDGLESFYGHIVPGCQTNTTLLYRFNYTTCFGIGKLAATQGPKACAGFTIIAHAYLTCLGEVSAGENGTDRSHMFDLAVSNVRISEAGARSSWLAETGSALLDALRGNAPDYSDQVSANFSKPFRFLRANNGTVVGVQVHPGEDSQVANIKKGIAESFQVNLVFHSSSAVITEVGANGARNSTYIAVTNEQAPGIAVQAFYDDTALFESNSSATFNETSIAWIRLDGTVMEVQEVSEMVIGYPRAPENATQLQGLPMVAFTRLSLASALPRIASTALASRAGNGQVSTESLKHTAKPAAGAGEQRTAPARSRLVRRGSAIHGLLRRLEEDPADSQLFRSLSLELSSGTNADAFAAGFAANAAVESAGPRSREFARRVYETLAAADTEAAFQVIVDGLGSQKLAIREAAIGSVFHATSSHPAVVDKLFSLSSSIEPALSSRASLALGKVLEHADQETASSILLRLVSKACSNGTAREAASVSACATAILSAGNAGKNCPVNSLKTFLQTPASPSDSQVAEAAVFSLRRHAHRPDVRAELASLLARARHDETIRAAVIDAAHRSLSEPHAEGPDALDMELATLAEPQAMEYLAKRGFHHLLKRAWSDSVPLLDDMQSTSDRYSDLQRYPAVRTCQVICF